ncbi:MAG: hypothetical protein BMS9Abin02_1263 [Anaerolineae bacterium]|nr:MAG: hypothetical protein BMS9Abin02_1263 [Anaerolineae bacterium]
MKAKNILPAAVGFLVGALILTWWLSPRLAAWFPEEGLVSSTGTIGMTFTKPVTSDEVASNLLIEPAVKGEFWKENNTVWFRPQKGFNYDQVYTVTLTSGLKSANGLPSLFPYEKSFQVSKPRLIFLLEDDGVVNVWQQSTSETPQQVTMESEGVWDYSLLSDGKGILVSSIDKNGTDDLVQIGFDGQREILLECRDVRCRAGRQQPGGQLIAYERQSIDESAKGSEVWLLDALTGSEQPAYSRELAAEMGLEGLESRFPRWSRDGKYLAYYKPDARLIIIEPIFGGRPILIPANLQMLGEWSPERNQIAFIEQVFDVNDLPVLQDEEGEDEAYKQPVLFNHLIVADVDTGEVVDLSEGERINDGLPVWHPNGESLAVPRENSGSGRQIWVVEPEGKKWLKLTDDPFFHHSGLSWSPDGNKLALMLVPVEATNLPAQVQALDLESGEMTLISERGFLPGWLP